MMEHSFDIDIAKKYGIREAILLRHLYFWIEKNKANKKNFYDNNYWTYNSKKAFAELFPYMNTRQIDYAIKKLIENGLVITGNYNKLAYDRTLWYAITKKGYSILQKCEMESTKLGNAESENVEAIPDINTDKETDINNKEINKEMLETEFEKLWELYPNKQGKAKALASYIKARKKGVPYEEIERGVKTYAEYVKGKDRQYIKHGSTWFNQECWNDELNAPKNDPTSFDVDDFFDHALKRSYGETRNEEIH